MTYHFFLFKSPFCGDQNFQNLSQTETIFVTFEKPIINENLDLSILVGRWAGGKVIFKFVLDKIWLKIQDIRINVKLILLIPNPTQSALTQNCPLCKIYEP